MTGGDRIAIRPAGDHHHREYAETDSDFDAIRDEPGFKELIAG